MIKNKRKGFTLTELIIVIAVIAILAAILIPVFASLIRKSNLDSDKALVRNLNMAVEAYKEENGKDDINASQALQAVREHGYVLASLTAKTDNCYFVWEDKTDQFILLEAILPKNGVEQYEVLFVESNEDIETMNKKWNFVIKYQDIIDILKTNYLYKDKATFLSVAVDFSTLQTLTGDSESNTTIYVNDDFSFENNKLIIDRSEDEIKDAITIDLQGSSIGVNDKILINSGSLIIKNGEIVGNGTGYAFYVMDDELSKVKVENVNIDNVYVGFFSNGKIAQKEDSVDGDYEIVDTTMTNCYIAFCPYNGTLTVKGETRVECDLLVNMSAAGRLIIEDGSYEINTQFAYMNCYSDYNKTSHPYYYSHIKFWQDNISQRPYFETSFITELIISGGDFSGNFFNTINKNMFSFLAGTSWNQRPVRVVVSGGVWGNEHLDYMTFFDTIYFSEGANIKIDYKGNQYVDYLRSGQQPVRITKANIDGQIQYIFTIA